VSECAVDGCARTNPHAKGLCKTHYNRRLKGFPDGGGPLKRPTPCAFDGCERRSRARGLCASHDWQQKNGKPLSSIADPDPERTCSGPQCDRKIGRRNIRGLCKAHNQQRISHGSLVPIRDPRPIRDPEVFWTRVQKRESGCWEWTSNITGAGYGSLSLGAGKNGYAHRYSYELMRGSIPDGLTIDHLCRNTRCVNPDHLEPVTQAENNRRARAAKNGG